MANKKRLTGWGLQTEAAGFIKDETILGEIKKQLESAARRLGTDAQPGFVQVKVFIKPEHGDYVQLHYTGEPESYGHFEPMHLIELTAFEVVPDYFDFEEEPEKREAHLATRSEYFALANAEDAVKALAARIADPWHNTGIGKTITQLDGERNG